MRATLDIIGLYEYDSTIFDNMVVPTGVNKTLLVNNILADCAELEVLYPRPDVIKTVIGYWSNKNLSSWTKIYATTNLEYNPIENYDRNESITDNSSVNKSTTGSTTENGSQNDSTSTTENASSNGSMSGTSKTEQTGTSSNTHMERAFNAPVTTQGLEAITQDTRTDGISTGSGFADKPTTDNTTGNQTATQSAVTRSAQGAMQTATTTSTNNSEAEQSATTHTARVHGNIGVTTTQQMIEEERRVSSFTIYDHIIESFKARFCILVY